MTRSERLRVIIDELNDRARSEPLRTLGSTSSHKLVSAKRLLEAGEKNLNPATRLVVGFLTDALLAALEEDRLALSVVSELANLVGSAESLPEDSRQVSIDFGGNPVICQV